jgi:hypothetical protein
MNERRVPPIAVGTAIAVEEPNYRYGTGRLLLRITSLGARHREHDGLWLELRGHEIDPTGREDPRERHAVVRLHGITIVSSADEL